MAEKKLLRRIKITPPLLSVLLGVVVLALVLFVPPVYGISDNGEFGQILAGNGLYKLDRGQEDEYFSYAGIKYGVNKCHTEVKAPVTSVNLFIKAAMLLNQLFAKDKMIFDIRYYGFLLGLYFLLALYLLVEAVTERFPGGAYLTAGLCVFIFCDTAYLLWFHSFYGEGIIYPSLVMLVACVIQPEAGRYKTAAIITGGFSAVLMVMAKPGDVMLWLLATGAFLFILYQNLRRNSRKKVTIACGIIAVIFLTGGIAAANVWGKVSNIERYHAMTRAMMSSSDNPRETAEFFGLDESYSLLDGTSAYERFPVIDADNELLVRDFYSKYGTGRIILYYLSHPGDFLTMLETAASQSYEIDGGTVGNYSRESGNAAGDNVFFFRAYSEAKAVYVPGTLGFLLIFGAVFCVLGRKDWSCTGFLFYCLVMGCVAMAVSVIRSGAVEAARDMFFYNVAFDIALFIMTAQFINWIWARRRRK